MAGVSIDVRGIPEVQAALGKISGRPARQMLQRASTAGAKALKPFVKAAAPRGATGKLRRSISARGAKRNRPGAVVSARPAVAFYRHMVIGGTRRGVKPNPFIERGLEAGRSAAEAAIDRVLSETIDGL